MIDTTTITTTTFNVYHSFCPIFPVFILTTTRPEVIKIGNMAVSCR